MHDKPERTPARTRCLLAASALAAASLAAGAALAQGGIDNSSYESEDFEVTEEGMVFDHSRTGLLYKRNLYIRGDNVTFLPQGPTAYNDTRDVRDWKIYVSHWEQDAPNFVIVYIRDDSNFYYSRGTIDLKVTIGHYDRNRNMVEANEVVRRDLPVERGLNRYPINIMNYDGDIVWVHLIGVKQKIPYHAVDATGD